MKTEYREMNKCIFKIQENYERLLDCTISPVEKENLKNEIKELKTKINSINKELENLKISPPPNK